MQLGQKDIGFFNEESSLSWLTLDLMGSRWTCLKNILKPTSNQHSEAFVEKKEKRDKATTTNSREMKER